MKAYKKLLVLFFLGLFSLNVYSLPFDAIQEDDPAIIIAAKQQDMEKLEELIGANDVDLEERCRLDGTALSWAFYFMWADGVKKLLEAGANIAHESDDGTSLWHILMLSGQGRDEEEGLQASLELYEILKRSGLKIKTFECESLEEIEDCTYRNPELIKRFFSDIRFKKGFWWLYCFIYRPLWKFLNIFVWMEENFGQED